MAQKSKSSSTRGFAAMDQGRQREIASAGGRASHENGRAHEFDSREGQRAGRLGGEAVSRDRKHMAEIGARGGRNSHGGHGSSGRDDDRGRPEQGTSRGNGSRERDVQGRFERADEDGSEEENGSDGPKTR